MAALPSGEGLHAGSARRRAVGHGVVVGGVLRRHHDFAAEPRGDDLRALRRDDVGAVAQFHHAVELEGDCAVLGTAEVAQHGRCDDVDQIDGVDRGQDDFTGNGIFDLAVAGVVELRRHGGGLAGLQAVDFRRMGADACHCHSEDEAGRLHDASPYDAF